MRRTPLVVTRSAGLAALVLVACLAGPAARAAASVPPEDQRAPLDLFVNDVSKGQALVVVRPGDALVPVAALEKAGLNGFAGRRETIGDETFVSLASLAPGITYTLSERDLTLRITAGLQYLGTTRLDLRSGLRPEYSYQSAPSAFLNYGVNWREGGGTTAAAEAAASVKGTLVASTFSWKEGQSPVRGLTTVTIDDRKHLRRVMAGDTYVADRLLGGGVFMGGVRVAREYSIDPYFIQYPTLGMSGAVTTPSTVDVYVDNRLVRQERVDPGRFELANVPVPNGSSQTRLVIRDAFGREQEMSSPFYLTNTVLARGLQEYDYSVGFTRDNLGTSSADYGQLALFARHRYGFSDSLTGGVRVEARQDLVSAGPSVAARLPAGEIEAGVAASRSEAQTGWAIGGGYQYAGRPVSVGAAVRVMSARYATLSLDPGQDRPKYDVAGYVGGQVGQRLSLNLQAAVAETRDGLRRARVSGFATSRVTKRVSAFASAGRSWNGHAGAVEVSVGISVCVGNQTSATASVGRDAEGRARADLDMQRSLPLGEGVGYRVHASSGSQDATGGRVQYQGRYGQYDAGVESIDGTSATTVNVAGAVVGIGGKAFATRPVQQGFALVQVPGVAGVRAYLSNQEIGRTDRNGNLLIPNLLPYYANRLSIADEDVPIDRAVSQTEQSVATPYRGGAKVVFPASQVRSVTGRVTIESDGRWIVPDFGDVVLLQDTGETESPIGRQGEFYLEHVAPGRHEASVRFGGAACIIALDVPASSEPIVDLGVVRCSRPVPARQP